MVPAFLAFLFIGFSTLCSVAVAEPFDCAPGTPLNGDPSFPLPGWDAELFGDKAPKVTPREFFDLRGKDKTCQQERLEAKKQHEDKMAEVRKMNGSNRTAADIAFQEGKLDALWQKWMHLENQCGRCYVKPVKKGIRVKGGSGFWYFSQGACQLTQTDSAALKKSFESMRTSLSHLPSYKEFSRIVGLWPTNAQEDAIETNQVQLGNPFKAYMMVRGLEIPRINRMIGYNYFLQNSFTTPKLSSGVQGHIFEYSAVPPPKTVEGGFNQLLKNRKIQFITEGGRALDLLPVMLHTVHGRWEHYDDGYFAYSTYADFKQQIPALDNLGCHMHMDALQTMGARSGEPL